MQVGIQYGPIRTVAWQAGRVRLIDQTALPTTLRYVELADWREVAEAIRTMVVRGAPAIGCTAALGLALGAHNLDADPAGGRELFLQHLSEMADTFRGARPTAVNLSWAVERMVEVARNTPGSPVEIKDAMLTEALAMLEEDLDTNRRMGQYGAELLTDEVNILTHCNAGALATVGYGTALGVVRAAVEAGKHVHVYADETRPRLQGMKLTAWELAWDQIPVTLIADNMAASVMRSGKVDCVIVGADRIAANGDTANKIGTYSLAVVACYHRVPFYVAAPLSTFDLTLTSGAQIPIEQRDGIEMTQIDGVQIAPEGVPTLNPAFDVTPGELVTAFITERGIVKPPYVSNIAAVAALCAEARAGAGHVAGV